MNITYVGNFSEAMKDYTEEKMSKIERKGVDCENVRVKFDSTPREFIVEVSINNKIRNCKKGNDFYAIIVKIVDSICSQITKYKKLDYEENETVESETTEDSLFEVARHKMLFLEEMSQEEAISQMEMLDHDFFIYKDIDLGCDVCVVYRRKNDTYGVIQCR